MGLLSFRHDLLNSRHTQGICSIPLTNLFQRMILFWLQKNMEIKLVVIRLPRTKYLGRDQGKGPIQALVVLSSYLELIYCQLKGKYYTFQSRYHPLLQGLLVNDPLTEDIHCFKDCPLSVQFKHKCINRWKAARSNNAGYLIYKYLFTIL